MTSLFSSLFRFKAWSHAELYARLEVKLPTLPDDAAGEVLRLLSHIHVIDRIFQGHLTGAGHDFKAPNFPEIPGLAALQPQVARTDQWYVGYVHQLPTDRYGENIAFIFTDGQHGHMSREEMLTHVLQHGGYHRGSIGRILVQHGIAPPRETFTRFLHEQEPQRREQG